MVPVRPLHSRELMFAFVRCKRLPTSAAIAAASSHALGSDRSARSRRREGYDGPRAITLIKNDKNQWDKPALVQPPKNGATELPYHVDYKTAYQRFLKANDARKAPNAHAAMHLIIGVSPEHFGKPDGTHEGHDYRSKKVQNLLIAAAKWAEEELGGVWAARYDLDEKGFGIVDVMCSPVRPHGKNGKPYVSIRKAQAELQEKYPGAAKGFGAMQSSWADYASQALGATFDRGIPKKLSGREHLIAEQYGEAMDAGRKRVSDLESQVAHMTKKIKDLTKKARELGDRVVELTLQRDRIAKRMKNTFKAVAGFRGRLTAWAVSRYRAASRPMFPPDPEHEELADEAIGLAAALVAATAEDTTIPTREHREHIRRDVHKKRRERGWDKDHPEAPLIQAWKKAMQTATEPMPYDQWRHELAHVSARKVKPDLRDLIRLARRLEKSLGTYMTRRERRRRQQAGEPDPGSGGIER